QRLQARNNMPRLVPDRDRDHGSDGWPCRQRSKIGTLKRQHAASGPSQRKVHSACLPLAGTPLSQADPRYGLACQPGYQLEQRVSLYAPSVIVVDPLAIRTIGPRRLARRVAGRPLQAIAIDVDYVPAQARIVAQGPPG